MQFEVGQVVGDYEILQVVGAGGMGRVYKVRNVLSQRVEAMKVLLADLEGQPDLMNRFLREIRVVATLRHPFIAGLLTAQRHGNSVLMLMDFVEGESLDRIMRRYRVPIEDTIRYAQQTLDALSYAHQCGVVHRDIKPANILVTETGDAILTDFGIAVAGRDVRLTQAGSTLGSLFYISPEQIDGKLAIDGRADLYSLGIMMYEMATGRRPIEGPNDYSILTAHMKEMPPPPIELEPSMPPELSKIIMRALAKDRLDRYQSADEMKAQLDELAPPTISGTTTSSTLYPQYSGAVATAKTPVPPPPAPEPAGTPKWIWGAVAGGVVVLGAVLGAVFLGGGEKAPNAAPATSEARLPDAPPLPQLPSSPPPSGGASPRAAGNPPAGEAKQGDAIPKAGAVAPGAPMQVQLETEPPGAAVSVDNGASTCTSPCAAELAPGRHSVRATLAGYRDALNLIEVPKDAKVTLKMSQRTGSLAVRSDPTDAQIFVNGQAQSQRTPALLTLPVGKYKVVLKKQGHPDYEDDVEVVDQVTRTMEVTWGR